MQLRVQNVWLIFCGNIDIARLLNCIVFSAMFLLRHTCCVRGAINCLFQNIVTPVRSGLPVPNQI